MKGTLLCFLSGFAIAAAKVDSAPPNDLDRATVTIPYVELRKLWEAAQAKKEVNPPPSPPMGSVIHSAELQLHFGELTSTVEAIFDIESLDAGWQSIRLLSGDVSLDKNDAQDQPVIWQDGYALLTNKVGRSRVKLEFATAGVKSLTTPRDLKLHVESATIKRLRISGVPDGFEVRVNGHLPTSIADEEAMFALPGASGEITVTLSAPAPAPPPARPSKWEGQSQVLVQSIEGHLQFVTRTRVHADGGSGLEAAFTLPASATVINTTGEDMADSVNERTEEGKRTLRVRWKTPGVLDREVTFSWASSQFPTDERWLLHAPDIVDAAEGRNFFAVAIPEGVELTGDAGTPVGASQRLPEWMRTQLRESRAATFESGRQATLVARVLPIVATAEAIIAEAKAELRLVADGSMQVSSLWNVRHQTPQALRLELPAEVELLGCTVGGRPTHPVQREKGTLEILLPKPDAVPCPPAGKEPKEQSPLPCDTGMTAVTLVYAAKTAALDPVSGKVSLSLPRTPFFIERLTWSIALPDTFEITAIEGNVRLSAGAQRDANRGEQVIALRKDLCRAESPRVEMFYQRRGSDR